MVTFLAVRVRTITREEAFDKCTRIAQVMSADFGEDLAEAILEPNPFFYGAWFQAEPYRFDGRDAEESAAAVTLASQAGVLRGIVGDLSVLVEGSAGSST